MSFKPVNPAVTHAAGETYRTGSLVLVAAFCPGVFLLSVHPSGRWLVGAVGTELHFNSIRLMLSNALQPPFASIGTNGTKRGPHVPDRCGLALYES